MGPRLLSRGKGWSVAVGTVADAGFNGATTLESWKGCFTQSRSGVMWCFNGATTLESWKGPGVPGSF